MKCTSACKMAAKYFISSFFAIFVIMVVQLLVSNSRCLQINQSINPILIRVYLHIRGWLDLSHFNSNLSNFHSPSRSIQGILLFFKPTLLLSFSTCTFHVFFAHPRFLLPFTSNSNAFLKTCPSSLLNIFPYHLTPFAFAI